MNISVEKLLDKLKYENINLIDIRSKNRYNNSHIENAINIPSINLIENPSKYLSKNKTYYLYCDSGYTSNEICIRLNNLGYNTISVLGGYNYYLLIK